MRIRTREGFGVAQFLAALGSAALMVGTVVGQAGHDPASGSANPMAAMKMMDGSMPGMGRAAETTASGAVGDMMTMPDGTTMAASLMPAPTAPVAPPVACSHGPCTVVLAAAEAVPVRVLGAGLRLRTVARGQVVLLVNGRKLTLHQGRAVVLDNLKFYLAEATPARRTASATISVRRVRGRAT